MVKDVTSTVKYIGVDDTNLDLFESQYYLPAGMAYNSYVILDEKVAIMDTVDKRGGDEWLVNLKKVLGERKPDYLVVHHMEPDHSALIQKVLEDYPECMIVCSKRAVSMLSAFFVGFDFTGRIIEANEKEPLSLGQHSLKFIAAPMVHWPEVIVSYDETDKILFSADAFGKFGALCNETEDWACEARRYYFNICGKYGTMVQNLLKKVSALDVQIICPLHGPILKENLSYYIGLYNTWSNYEVETPGTLIAYTSIHGNTAEAANKLAEILKARNAGKVAITDLSRDDQAEAIEDAFRLGNLVLAASSYDGGLFPPMYNFIHKLEIKGYQKRRVAIIENGSWAPSAGKVMKSMLETMKELEILEPVITIRGKMKPADVEKLNELADLILAQ